MLNNFRKNAMGTVTFDAQFPGMRKAQDFVVYPIEKGQPADVITVQSDTRIGRINLTTGNVAMSPPQSGGAYMAHLRLGKVVGTLAPELLAQMKDEIAKTAGSSVGSRGVTTDNAGASAVALI
jgi:hypothetical protein